MMKHDKRPLVYLLGIWSFTTVANGVQAGPIQLLTNGNFETGTFAGWTVSNQANGSGNFFISTPGTGTTVSSHATSANAAGGSYYAVSDQTDPGTHIITQSFTVPAGTTSTTLSFQMFVDDWSSGLYTGTLDYTGGNKQFATVDILTAGASPFSTAAADVVDNLYLGTDSPLIAADPYKSYNFNLTNVLTPGSTYQTRFGESDNSGYFNQGVDNVSLAATVPEPTSAGVIGCVAAAKLLLRRRRHSVDRCV